MAIRHFSKQLKVELKVTSELNCKHKEGEMVDLTVKSLPVKKRRRPLLLGEKLDSEVKCRIQAVCEGGDVVTTFITIAAATAIVRKLTGVS